MMRLVWPALEHLPRYAAALAQGWSADNIRGKAAADDELAKIAQDAPAFVVALGACSLSLARLACSPSPRVRGAGWGEGPLHASQVVYCAVHALT